jgi:hypothetical protein
MEWHFVTDVISELSILNNEYVELEAIWLIDLQIEHLFTYTKKESIFATRHITT